MCTRSRSCKRHQQAPSKVLDVRLTSPPSQPSGYEFYVSSTGGAQSSHMTGFHIGLSLDSPSRPHHLQSRYQAPLMGKRSYHRLHKHLLHLAIGEAHTQDLMNTCWLLPNSYTGGYAITICILSYCVSEVQI